MDRDADRSRGFTRRALALGGLKLGLLGVLGGRLYYLQVEESDRYKVLAESNRINMRLLAPSRGLITDRFGAQMAVNDQNFRVVLVAEEAKDIQGVLGRLGQNVPLTDADLARIVRDVKRRRAFVPVTVKENLSWDQVSWIDVNGPELPGLSIEVGESRRYPFGVEMAHIIGYVGAVAEADLTGEPVLSLPGFRIGKSGVERQYETDLRGVAGSSQVEVNAVGRVIRELNRDEGKPGQEVRLTIDFELQRYVMDRLKTEFSAAAVIMDVHSGDVLAMASHPSYDANLFPNGISTADWRRLVEDPYGILNNKVINGQYPPGSTFKIAVAATALEAGVVTPDQRVFCPGYVDLGDHRFHCWKRGGHGSLTVVDAMAQSCDVFFYEMARRLGIDRLAEGARKFGIGQKLGVDLPNERPGLMPDKAWKEGTMGTSWQMGESLIAGIGQGYVLATPLQLATMTARLVNGGKAVVPRLVMEVGGQAMPEVPDAPPIGVAKGHIDTVIEGTVAVMTRGTGKRSQIKQKGMEMGGKSGTSQVRRITMAERAAGVNPDNWPWNQRHHAWFVAYAPVGAPRYACSVIVEHGGGGSEYAAPIARDILLECQQRESGRRLLSAAPGEGADKG